MTTHSTIHIDVTEDERQRIEESARRRGYETVSEYIRALLQAAIEELRPYTPQELLAMPAQQRTEILRRQAEIAAHEYSTDPQLTAFNADGDWYDYAEQG
jgi:Arc/MetJ-type ribon-helix-helix transcriptional regulator